jgi:hypothetical protein
MSFFIAFLQIGIYHAHCKSAGGKVERFFQDIVDEVSALMPEADKDALVHAIARAVRKNVWQCFWNVEMVGDPQLLEAQKGYAYRINGNHMAELFSRCERRGQLLSYRIWVVRP